MQECKAQGLPVVSVVSYDDAQTIVLPFVKGVPYDDFLRRGSEQTHEKIQAYLKSIAEAHQKGIKGTSLHYLYSLLKKEFSFKLSEEIFLKKYNRFLKKIYQEKVRLNPYVIDLLNELKTKKYKLALASSTSHRFIGLILKKFSLTDYFDVVVSADDVDGKSKPDPEIFLLTSRKLGISPKNCVVIEDSLNGIMAAKRAGIFRIAYEAENVSKLQKTELPDYEIKDFQELLNVNFNKILYPIERAQKQ